MKKRFFLLAILASLSLSGCDALDKFFDGDISSLKEEIKEPAQQNQESKVKEEETSKQEEGQTTNPEEGGSTTIITPPSTNVEELSEEVKAYYKNIPSTATGSTLKVKLYDLIKGHSKYDYNSLEVAMKITDRDYELDPIQPNESEDYDPYMKLLYADYNGDKSTAKKWSTSQGSFGMMSNYVWNKEHIWAKSNGFSKSEKCEAYSDLHHLRASDWKCNNTRGNYPFGNCKDHTSKNASEDYTENRKTDNYLQNGLFEPRDSDKGDVARALFYMATRYYNGDGSNKTNLTLTTGTDSSGGKWGYLDTLLEWNDKDKPDYFERNRNDLVQTIQGNRNPYIDHPEWARQVFAN